MCLSLSLYIYIYIYIWKNKKIIDISIRRGTGLQVAGYAHIAGMGGRGACRFYIYIYICIYTWAKGCDMELNRSSKFLKLLFSPWIRNIMNVERYFQHPYSLFHADPMEWVPIFNFRLFWQLGRGFDFPKRRVF